MPAIAQKNVAAGTANALQGNQFETVPPQGALVTIYGSTAVAGGALTYKVGTEVFLDSGELNIESSADVVDVDRDLILDREPVPGGQQFLSVEAQICNFLIIIEEL